MGQGGATPTSPAHWPQDPLSLPAGGRSPPPARCTWSRCELCAGLGVPTDGSPGLSRLQQDLPAGPQPRGFATPFVAACEGYLGAWRGKSCPSGLGDGSPPAAASLVGPQGIPEPTQEQHPANASPAPTNQPGCTPGRAMPWASSRPSEAEPAAGGHPGSSIPIPCPVSPVVPANLPPPPQLW